MKKLLIVGVIAATALLGAVVAYAVSNTPIGACGDGADCKGKIDVTWWNNHLQVCLKAKVSCQGQFTGTNWNVSASGPYGGPPTNLSIGTNSGPNCNASTFDSAGVSEVKGDCDTDSSRVCDGKTVFSKAKAKVEVDEKLCPCDCQKPDKVLGCQFSLPCP